MPKSPINTPKFDPIYTLILVSVMVFLGGLLLTNEQARMVFMHPFS